MVVAFTDAEAQYGETRVPTGVPSTGGQCAWRQRSEVAEPVSQGDVEPKSLLPHRMIERTVSQDHNTLTLLDMRSNDVSSEGLRSLASALVGNAVFCRLDMRRNPLITESTVSFARKLWRNSARSSATLIWSDHLDHEVDLTGMRRSSGDDRVDCLWWHPFKVTSSYLIVFLRGKVKERNIP